MSDGCNELKKHSDKRGKDIVPPSYSLVLWGRKTSINNPINKHEVINSGITGYTNGLSQGAE